MNMSKLTRKTLDINTLKGHHGIHVKNIPNLSEWLLSYKPEYKTGELVAFLKEHGVQFASKHESTELSYYLPPRKSIGLSLEPYTKRLYTLYLENYRKLQPSKPSAEATSTLDYQVLSQWTQNIHALDGLKRTALRALVLYHPDKDLIYEVREQAWYAYIAEMQLGTKYDQSSLFTGIETKPQDEPQDEPVAVADQDSTQLLLDVIKSQAQAIEANYEQIKKLQDELKQIKNLLNIRVQDLLRAVK